jgi:PTH1 family peptidyl-tRNA hydrolase
MSADLLVVGLGNPGSEFARTRHNAGADVVEILGARHRGRLRKTKDRALVDDVRVGGKQMVLAIPLTYMNDSGIAVARLARRNDVEVEQIVIVHDELDLPPAVLRVKLGGGLAGHNGLRSIKQHLHSDEFVRVRIGVGKPPSKEQGADHVLSRASKRDREAMAVTLEEAADAVEMILTDGVDAAMNRYNTRTPSS